MLDLQRDDSPRFGAGTGGQEIGEFRDGVQEGASAACVVDPVLACVGCELQGIRGAQAAGRESREAHF